MGFFLWLVWMLFQFGTQTNVPEENQRLPKPRYQEHYPQYIPPPPATTEPAKKEAGGVGGGRSETESAGKKVPSPEHLRKVFLDLTRKAVPTAKVHVVFDGGNVVIKGTVANANDSIILEEICRGLFTEVSITTDLLVEGLPQVELEVVVATLDRAQNGIISFPETRGGIESICQVIKDRNTFLAFLEDLNRKKMASIRHCTVATMTSQDGGIPGDFLMDNSPKSILNQVEIRLLPILLGNEKIHLEVYAEASNSRSVERGTCPVAAPGFFTRGDRKAFLLEDGQTVAVNGRFLEKAQTGSSTNQKEVLLLITPRQKNK